MKRILAFVFFCLLFFILPVKIFADETFLVSLDTTYFVSENSNTHVEIKGQIQNRSNKFFPSMYSMQIGFNDIQNIFAKDTGGVVVPKQTQLGTSTKILLPLNYRADGLGAKNNFVVSFDTKQIAKKNGNIWEVNVPGVSNLADFNEFIVHIRVPDSFGAPSYIKPPQIGQTLDFDKNTIGSAGIAIAFGDLEYYKFNLQYHLENKNLFPATRIIALPPSTNYQSVFISSLTPTPKNVLIDSDGNWIADYSLSPGQKINILAQGSIISQLNPKPESLSEQQKKIYLAEQPYWQVNNDGIKKLATDLKTPRAIFDYVVNHLKYDYSRVAGSQQRLGALKILENPESGVCLEFSDLFIALARAAGIPAREIDGFAYTDNTTLKPITLYKDILHTWPEYYDPDKKAWIMVDPTWQNTTRGIDYFSVFDFDHIAFSIKGRSSVLPLPAGSYKTPDFIKKDVDVSFSDKIVSDNPKVSVFINIASKVIAGLPVNGFLDIKNSGTALMPAQKIKVTSSVLSPKSQVLTFSALPPMGSLHLPISFSGGDFLTKKQTVITIAIAGNTITKNILVVPFFLGREIIYEGVAFGIFIIIILIIAAKAGRLPFFRKRG